jgi:hypothetical protein
MSDATEAQDAGARRLRLLTIFGIAILAGIELGTTTQPWWTVHLQNQNLAVGGTVAAPALSALALTGIALAAALAIAGPVFRLILGILQLFLGGTVVLTSALSVADPAKGSESLISHATGVAGIHSLHALIERIDFAPWGWVAIVTGVVSVLAGVYLLATFRRWPVASRKYQAVRFDSAGQQVESAPDGKRDAVIDWDALSEGTDPTRDA